jgi:tetratricopeptide (TPR) repeat protein
MKRHMLTVIMMTACFAAPAAAQTIEDSVRQAQEAAARAAQTLNSVDVSRALEAARVTINSADVARALEAAKAAQTLVGDARIAAAVDAAHAGLDAARAGFEWQSSDRDRQRDAAQRAAEDAQREKERAQREKEREGGYYEQGQNALDSGKWDRAVSYFDRVIEMKAARADAALYWKAYAQNKQGQRSEALATIATLMKDYPKSRYLSDAKALEVEVKNNSGQRANPAQESDDDMKLMVLGQMQPSDDVVPALQKLLQGNSSPRVKARALFVLAQGNSPKAREVLMNIAKGGSNPDLQMKAVQYLGVHGGRENRAALAEIYGSSSDIDLKKRILNSFMVAGDKERLLTAAQSEQNPELRASAVQQLGVMSASEELWSLYQKESSVDVKRQIIRALFVGGNVTRMSEIAKSDSNPELRLYAVKQLGVMGSKRTGDTLVEIYSSDKDPEVKRAVINGLFVSNNAEQLVALARKEQDPVMKKDMVSKLSNMHSKVATDFLLEILNK